MNLYKCNDCDFGIGGSHPDTAEDEYELRQDIEAHEEMHRREEPPAALDAEAQLLLRELTKKGAVILPDRPKPLTRDDVRAIVREEIERWWKGGGSVSALKRGNPSLKADEGLGHQGLELPDVEVEGPEVVVELQQPELLDQASGDGEIVRDSSPPVDGRSSPTVGDGQVAEGVETSSATGAAHEQRAFRLLSGVTPDGAAELDALPDDCLIEATGSYLKGDGGFSRCWARPVPSWVTDDDRLWQVLVHGNSDYMSSLTASALIGVARVLYRGEEPAGD
ncbi:hypothetical protein Mbo4_038 [Rhodococcus phage Mbo4]|uniref:Uncharacterized protein n=1 Tax=Rhodococcus phage Mbo4 TaxID=2936912 RepID=A0A9E7LH99_9CAUD|nr:hypothetical protein QEH50_gp38 [Rhodococcus phage Mbo4]URG17528.1 hypothetical protein Mbo4_038 [Rhodococcus phage Mbo4]